MLGRKGYDLGFIVKAAVVLAALAMLALLIKNVGGSAGGILEQFPDWLRFT